jgi:hypothetical protein
MTHLKDLNELGRPVPHEPNWKNEAMRMSALLLSAMTGGAEAEQRAAKLELERDAILRVVTDNHVALMRAEAAEYKLEKAVAALEEIGSYDKGPFAGIAYTARAVLAELEAEE